MTTRTEYVEKAKAKLDLWDAKIDAAEARLREASVDTRIAYQNHIEEMRESRNEAQRRLRELQASSEDAWADIRQGFEKAWDDLESAFETASGRLT